MRVRENSFSGNIMGCEKGMLAKQNISYNKNWLMQISHLKYSKTAITKYKSQIQSGDYSVKHFDPGFT